MRTRTILLPFKKREEPFYLFNYFHIALTFRVVLNIIDGSIQELQETLHVIFSIKEKGFVSMFGGNHGVCVYQNKQSSISCFDCFVSFFISLTFNSYKESNETIEVRSSIIMHV
jgi:hypothetical protein